MTHSTEQATGNLATINKISDNGDGTFEAYLTGYSGMKIVTVTKVLTDEQGEAIMRYIDKVNVGESKYVKVNMHPNAPVIVNFYTITKRGGKRYNTDPRFMRHTDESNVEAVLDWYNKMYNDFGRKFYYRGN